MPVGFPVNLETPRKQGLLTIKLITNADGVKVAFIDTLSIPGLQMGNAEICRKVQGFSRVHFSTF